MCGRLDSLGADEEDLVRSLGHRVEADVGLPLGRLNVVADLEVGLHLRVVSGVDELNGEVLRIRVVLGGTRR